MIGIETYQVARIVPELRRTQDLVAHTIEVITTAQALERAVQDAERGQRGFLITGAPAYLEPYTTGRQEIPVAISRLRQLTADDPEQQRRWPILEQQINIKLGELKRAIDARQNDGFAAAQRIVGTNVGADAMRAIDQIIDAAEAAENSLLKNRQALGDEAENRTRIIGLIGAGIALIIMIGGGAVLSQNFGRIVKSEKALRESEERLRLMISGIVDYSIFMLDPEGRVVFWNPGAERMKGYTAAEIIGRHFSCFYTREGMEADEPSRLLQAATRDGQDSGEGWRVRKDGSRFWASVFITAIRDHKGGLLGFTKLTRDMTEQKKAEAAIAQEREERQHAEGICGRHRRWTFLASLLAVSRTISTTCSELSLEALRFCKSACRLMTRRYGTPFTWRCRALNGVRHLHIGCWRFRGNSRLSPSRWTQISWLAECPVFSTEHWGKASRLRRFWQRAYGPFQQTLISSKTRC